MAESTKITVSLDDPSFAVIRNYAGREGFETSRSEDGKTLTVTANPDQIGKIKEHVLKASKANDAPWVGNFKASSMWK